MQLKDIGEFGLIEEFKRMIRLDPSVVVGPGDDCAVIEFNKREYLLATCDMIVEGVDFLSTDKPELVGHKAIAVSISDIASCGGIPRYCLVSMGLPRDFTLERAKGLAQGMFALARRFKINIIGGDLSRAGRLTVSVSMLGVVEKGNLVLRNRAEPGDMIFVTGQLGGSRKGKHLNFTPRVKEARLLVENFKINSMIDISDGLIQDLGHILEQSGVGAVIYEGLVPLSKDAADLNDAFYTGEDFELLFTLPRKQARKLITQGHREFSLIGEIVQKQKGFSLIDKRSRVRALRPKGFRHF